jgi:flap endonuclease-1
MGIHLLNRFLRSKNPKGINEISLSELNGKKIAIDISIYIYRYVSQEALLPNIQKMVETFQTHNIRPLFVFDGKKTEKKTETLNKRREDKNKAYKNYQEIKNGNNPFSTKNKRLMRELKRKSTFINIDMINGVKKLFDTCNISYITAKGEADILCAALANSKKVYAVLSEDTDMFAYGVPIVLKYFSFVKHTVVRYNTKDILYNLNITYEEFLTICILSGTDYNKGVGNFFDIYNAILKYKTRDVYLNNDAKFDEWLNTNNYDHIDNIDNILVSRNNYYLDSKNILKGYPFIVIRNTTCVH